MTSFRCSHCHKSYSRESWYRKHIQVCEKKRRFEETHKMDFHRGFRLYKHWRRRQGYNIPGRTKEITAEDFVNSILYNKIMELVKFTSENWVITSVRYLDFLIDYRIADKKWTNEETLSNYRTYIRQYEDPISQSKITFNAVKDWCDKNAIDKREFFAKITPGTALQMIISNKISPWVLFGYDRARDGLLTRVNDDWLCSLNEFINNKYWINKITNSEDTQRSIQAECERLFSDE
jgi:hypothetical protein